jgi:hypothetical protein
MSLYKAAVICERCLSHCHVQAKLGLYVDFHLIQPNPCLGFVAFRKAQPNLLAHLG